MSEQKERPAARRGDRREDYNRVHPIRRHRSGTTGGLVRAGEVLPVVLGKLERLVTDER
jgi:hypothetical protein